MVDPDTEIPLPEIMGATGMQTDAGQFNHR